ncbi:MAG: protein-tyrosine phosphatase family protein [Patulibacter sp.]
MKTWDLVDGVVELPDGRRVRGTGLRRARRGPNVPTPEFGVYLLGRDPRINAWQYAWVRWRDFQRPASPHDALAVLRDAHERAATERVEISCAGGTGRTGAALAVLALLSGVEPDEAVAWVREHYRSRAVETRGQKRWIEQVATSLAC